jgi:hypothetical protein
MASPKMTQRIKALILNLLKLRGADWETSGATQKFKEGPKTLTEVRLEAESQRIKVNLDALKSALDAKLSTCATSKKLQVGLRVILDFVTNSSLY